MRVFVTGATGFIGSAVVRELIDAGHDVTGLARSDASAGKLKAMGAKVHLGSVEDVQTLREAAAKADGAIHTAFFHAISHMRLSTRLRVILGGMPSGIMMRFLTAAADTDRRALEAIGSALSGTDRPLVGTFGTLGMKPGTVATEDDTYDPESLGVGRARTEDTLLAMASRGVRTAIIRLPPIVHGEGDGGFAPRLIQFARKNKQSVYVGDGMNRWPSVHRLDAAHLFRLALENAPPGARYHGVAEDGIAFKTIAEAMGEKVGVPARSKPKEEATKYISFLGLFAGTDNPTSSALTQARLDWRPAQPDLISDLKSKAYDKA
jgi:nucleoside-diphosphate-sugar epimerase